MDANHLDRLLDEGRAAVADAWSRVERIRRHNFRKVLAAFHAERVGDHHLAGSTGYGYGDTGREALEGVYARAFGAEAALVRPQLVSGTHAIVACLMGCLRPGDHCIAVTGRPYDTLARALKGPGRSLADWGISTSEIPLTPAGHLDWEAIRHRLGTRPRMVLLQRSRGYSFRPALTVAQIAEVVQLVRRHSPDTLIFVDNCYGEFVEEDEPTAVGVDLMAGSLIKNPGGGLAPAGGYVAGRQELIEQVAEALTAPGLGSRVGPTLQLVRPMLQGFFLAPHFVGESLCGGILAAWVFAQLSFRVSPTWDEPRADTVQAIRLGSPEAIQAFCRGIQAAGPVDAHVAPRPAPMPGYSDPIIMAAGTFVQGASSELSADAPMRPPYDVFLQAGLLREHAEVAIASAVTALVQAGLLPQAHDR